MNKDLIVLLILCFNLLALGVISVFYLEQPMSVIAYSSICTMAGLALGVFLGLVQRFQIINKIIDRAIDKQLKEKHEKIRINK